MIPRSDWSQIGKVVVKAIYCHSAYLTNMQSASCEMPGWMKHKLESRLMGEISTTTSPERNDQENLKIA